MTRRTKTFRLAAVAATSALVLAACGGGDDDGGSDDSSAPSRSDGVLTIGMLLPQTGSLAFLGPPEFAGVDLAIQEINEAGGVLGQDVVGVKADSGDTDSGIAAAETDKLLDADSDVIIGAASSGVSMTVVDKIMSAGTVMFSPANTSTDFDNGKFADPDLYFRTAPSDILQGAVMANLLIEDGKQNVAILARQDAYGETLAAEIKKGLEAAGSTVAATVFYGENAQSYDSQVAEIAESQPDAVVLVAFEETTTIVPQLVSAGVGPQTVSTYFVDGNTADYSEDLPAGTLAGTKGTIPGAEAAGDFRERLLTIDPGLTDFAYAGESYDATIVSALAAIAADSDAGDKIAEEIPGVTEGGTKCTTFAECAELLADGEDIDYDGVSGPIELGETGSPTAASIGIYQYGPDNTYTPVKYISGTI
ncbi:MAG: ABC transporter substrate-binding protein [Aeromicrobium sp.]|uniref:ABC transporter substrate-binding protein n=1 Tax=Aeromicrobium sp. TaxID=1871063 RepID=UPI00261231C5|nr:ABC transporter substrate-binding protein [Aeromicrobium sp.]MDF1703215.1 ABC transporter substrate-binding protein [Aeromicrobium sp.]